MLLKKRNYLPSSRSREQVDTVTTLQALYALTPIRDKTPPFFLSPILSLAQLNTGLYCTSAFHTRHLHLGLLLFPEKGQLWVNSSRCPSARFPLPAHSCQRRAEADSAAPVQRRDGSLTYGFQNQICLFRLLWPSQFSTEVSASIKWAPISFRVLVL